MVGSNQKAIIEIGKRRGFVLVEDIARFYPFKEIKLQMSKLVNLGYFKIIYDGIKIKWIYINKENEECIN